MKVPWAQKIPTTYYDVDEGKIHRYEAGPALLPNGAGIVLEDSGRMRALPRWRGDRVVAMIKRHRAGAIGERAVVVSRLER